ncbi:hypothetical protein, partial [Bacillus velezensis]|uniref:hypothetical protein n=1 Tax=Bacillus velezensis TaxID=492670 RepID=UPI001567407B
KEIIFEKAISSTNVVRNRVAEYLGSAANAEEITLTARQLNADLHQIMFNIGTLQSIVRATRASSEREFHERLEQLKISGNRIEVTMNLLSH